jgi:hypothetical protein
MNPGKLTVDISPEEIVIKIDDVPIGLVQECDISIKSEPSPYAEIKIRRWKRIGDDTVLTIEDLKEEYKGIYGVYATPFTNNLEMVEDEFTITQGVTVQ